MSCLRPHAAGAVSLFISYTGSSFDSFNDAVNNHLSVPRSAWAYCYNSDRNSRETQMLKLYVQTYAGFIIGKCIFSHDFPVGTGISVRTDRLGSIACILRGAELHLWLCVDLGIRTE